MDSLLPVPLFVLSFLGKPSRTDTCRDGCDSCNKTEFNPATPKKEAPTPKNVADVPTASAKYPPSAGPKAVPAAKALMIGAKVDARLSGVLISVTINVAAVLNAATPNPVHKRHKYSVSKEWARAIPPMPNAMADME